MPPATSTDTRVLPVFEWIHDVPPVLFIVVDATAEDDTCARRRQGQRVPRTDFSSAQRSAGVGKAHTPATIESRTYSGDPARDGDLHLPCAHSLNTRVFTVELGV